MFCDAVMEARGHVTKQPSAELGDQVLHHMPGPVAQHHHLALAPRHQGVCAVEGPVPQERLQPGQGEVKEAGHLVKVRHPLSKNHNFITTPTFKTDSRQNYGFHCDVGH